MAKREVPNNLTKSLVTLAKNLSAPQYNQVIGTMSALLSGITFQYEDDPLNINFHKDALEIYSHHKVNKKETKKLKKQPTAKIIPLRFDRGQDEF